MSNSITQRIMVSFTSDGVPPVVKAMQYDNNMRVVEVSMTANSVPFLVPDGCSVNIRMRKPDGTCVYNPALEVSGNTAKIVLTRQMLAFPGKASAILEVVGGENGEDVLGTARWCIDVAPNPVPEDYVKSTNEYKTVQQLAAEVENATEVVRDNVQTMKDFENNLELIKSVPKLAQETSANADAAQMYAEMAQQVSQGAVGYYATPDALRAAHAVASDGNWAIVGSTDTVWVWDSDSGDWMDTSQHIDMSQYYTKSEVQTMVQGAHSNTYTITVPSSGWEDGTLTFQGIACTKKNVVSVAGVTADTKLSMQRFTNWNLEAAQSYICQETGNGTVTFWATKSLLGFEVELMEVK